MPAPAADDRYLTLAELVAYSHLSIRTIMRHLASDTTPLPHYKIGGRVLVRRAEFDAWVAKIGTPEHVQRARTMEQKVTEAVDRFRRHR